MAPSLYLAAFTVFSVSYDYPKTLIYDFQFDFEYDSSIKMNFLVYIHLKTIIIIKVSIEATI